MSVPGIRFSCRSELPNARPLRMVAVPSAHSSEQLWCLEFSQDEKIIGRPWILGFICTYVFKLDDFFITTSGMYSL